MISLGMQHLMVVPVVEADLVDLAASILMEQLWNIFGDIFGDLFGGGRGGSRYNNGPMKGASLLQVSALHLKRLFSAVTKSWISI